MHVADGAVHRAEEALRLAVELLRPEPVVLAARDQRLRAFAPGPSPPLLPGRLVHHVRDEHRAGRAPHQLLELVGDVLAHAREKRVRQFGLRRELPGDEQDAGLTAEQRGVRRRRKLDLLREAVRNSTADTIIALGMAFFVNAAILVLAATVFNGKDAVELPGGEVLTYNEATKTYSNPKTNTKIPNPSSSVAGLM